MVFHGQQRGRHRRRIVSLVLGACFFSLVGAVPVQAGTLGQWFEIPRYRGVVAAAKVTYFNSGASNGEAGGFISIRNSNSAGRFYVQYKPDPRGPGGWNRGTPNVARGRQSLNNAWHDDFWSYTTGYKFRICKVRTGPDACGNTLLIEP